MLSLNLKKYSDDWRLGLFNSIKSGKIDINRCDIGSLIEDARVLNKTSSSETIIILGKFLEKFPKKQKNSFFSTLLGIFSDKDAPLNPSFSDNIVVKLSFATTETSRDNSLDVEICIYKNIINKLIQKRFTPHVITYVGSFRCPNFFQQLIALQYPTFPEKVSELNRNYFLKMVFEQMVSIEGKYVTDTSDYDQVEEDDPTYDFNIAQFLIIEKGNGGSLNKNFDNYSIEDWRSILFQTLYTFHVFSLVGLKHNDNHLENILIDKVDQINISYLIDESNYFLVPVSNFVKIFDFDLSYFKECPKNLKLDNGRFCKNYGMCNDNNAKFDVFIFLCGIYSKMKLQRSTPQTLFVIDFIESVVDKKLLKTEWGFHCRLCSFDEDHDCDGPYTPSDKEMAPVLKMLKNNIFKPYLNVKNPKINCDFVYAPPNVNRSKINFQK